MITHDTKSNADPLAPLVAAIKATLQDELLAVVRAEMRATAAEAKPEKVMLSLANLCRRYGCGRKYARKLIATRKLPAVERRCRGGKVGQFIHLADAERVLAGRKP